MRTFSVAALALVVAVLAVDAYGGPPAPLSVGQPAWSPDGVLVAFVGVPVGGTGRDVYVIGRNGAGLTNLTGGGDEHGSGFPAWSPDGTLIASGTEVSGPSPSREVYSVTPAGGGATQHVAVSGAIGPISWSYDGRWLAIDDHDACDRCTGRRLRPARRRRRRLLWRLVAADASPRRLDREPDQLQRHRRLPRRPCRPRSASADEAAEASPPRCSSVDRQHPARLVTRRRPAAFQEPTRTADRPLRDAPGRGPPGARRDREGRRHLPARHRVVYSGKGIWVVGADGKHRHQISPIGSQPRWSPTASGSPTRQTPDRRPRNRPRSGRRHPAATPSSAARTRSPRGRRT